MRHKADLSLGFCASSRNIASAFAEIGSSGIGSISIASAVKARNKNLPAVVTNIIGKLLAPLNHRRTIGFHGIKQADII